MPAQSTADQCALVCTSVDPGVEIAFLVARHYNWRVADKCGLECARTFELALQRHVGPDRAAVDTLLLLLEDMGVVINAGINRLWNGCSKYVASLHVRCPQFSLGNPAPAARLPAVVIALSIMRWSATPLPTMS